MSGILATKSFILPLSLLSLFEVVANSIMLNLFILLVCIVQVSSFIPPVEVVTKIPQSTKIQMTNTKNDNPSTSVSTKTKPKPKHDRTIDRRKSPALWRYDLDYSISPTSTADGSDNANKHLSLENGQSTLHKFDYISKGPPELMSPAGGWLQLKAAVANGADAVYLGLTSYSARARAQNFDPDPNLLYKHNFSNDLGDKLEAAAKGGSAQQGQKKKRQKTNDTGEYVPIEGKPASLAHAVEYAHKYHVRVYVAFNTLVFDNELHEVQSLIEKIWDCGVDAVIVQDVGVCKIVKTVVDKLSNQMKQSGLGIGKAMNGMPLEIHASTQQSVTDADGVSFAAEQSNATRVVLGRELSLSEITQISTNTDTEIEAFVHGALCVSYSGQCFSSDAWGGRSANRGQCAQACRLPYGLIANGELKHLSFDGIEGIMGGGSKGADNSGNEEIQYLLSPQDLCGIEQVEGLIKAGVSCLKIEGRLKDASYVAATTRAYRQAIDTTWNKLLEEQAASNTIPQRIISSPDEHVSRSDLTQVFARGQDAEHDGLTPGFFEGPQHQRLVRGRSPRHRGRHVGRVISSNRGSLVIELDDKFIQDESHLKRGDGIVVDRSMPQEKELGGPIYDAVMYDEGTVAIRFGRDVERDWMQNDKHRSTIMAPEGSHVWLTSDADIRKRMNRLAELDPPKSSAKVIVEGKVGEPLVIQIIDERTGKVGKASSLENMELATGSPINTKSITKAIGTLGNSQWSISDLDLSQLDDDIWCRMGLIKDTRRRALEDLESKVNPVSTDVSTTQDTVSTEDDPVVDQILKDMASDTAESEEPATTQTKLSVLARTEDQVDAICNMIESMDDSSGISEVIVDFLEIDGIRKAVSRIREIKSSHDLRVVVASPRIIKPGEEGIWQTLLKTKPDGLLVRSTGLLHRLMQLGGTGQQVCIKDQEGTMEVQIPELIGDFSLNVANAISAYELLESGLSRITAAYDLSGNAITELATLLGNRASQLEVVVHQHVPIFHTEHCVFARFLSNGDSYQDCGHVCTRNNVHLRDQNSKDNLVLADMGCRNTVFMSEAQSGAYDVHEWVKARVGSLRVELVDESGVDAVKIISSYLRFLDGDIYADDLWDVLKEIPDSNGRLGGVGVGSLRNDRERKSGSLSSSVH